ncbi:hypothetical protein BCL76_110190 [Streptomyces sp. CG 926]|uniref:hypothetical protein n=1 Tax=Streptomyces sp. CG 926 TaxID=1882405 RepID=UPI000D7B76C2|nr:hypothetical protein [Streptomyces sp. CG 926]PWK66704.1 hypothetical protein BCL76_110190 [Streptomyces sp. CG 926]
MNRRGLVALVGRRTALRYLLAGIVATAVSGCGSPVEKAITAYAKGSWIFTTNAGFDGILTITDDGRWSETRLGLSGRWEYDPSRIRITMDGTDSEGAEPYIVPSVPEHAEDALSGDYQLLGGWSLSVGEKMKARRDKDSVVLEFADFSDGLASSPDHIESLIFTLTRQAEAP